MRKIIILVLILASTSAQAGWKMYAPGQKDPIISSVDDPNAPPKPLIEVIEQPSPKYSTGKSRQVEPEDNFDLSGVEWRSSTGNWQFTFEKIR
jgi:hypothetical protein